jgi:hypothetical protein
MISRKSLCVAAIFLVCSGGSIGRAQDNPATAPNSSSESLGDAARKARAQKKEPAKPAKVFTNEDLGGLRGTINVIGDRSASSAAPSGKDGQKPDDKKAGNGTEAKDAKKEAPKEAPKDESYWRARFAAARKTLAQDTKELDVLQREYNLKLEQFSQDPNWAMHEQYSRADVNKTQSDIEAKKQDVEKDKQALSDLEDEMRKAGGAPGWANEPSGGGSDSRSSN